MRARLIGLVVVAVVATAVGAYRAYHDRGAWEPDSAIYIRMMLQDRGLSVEDARTETNRFMQTTAEVRDPDSVGFYGDHPPSFYSDQFALFRSRPVYPLIGAALYARFGPEALKIVSFAAYVAMALLMYALLASLAEPAVAVIGVLALAMSRPILDFAGLAMTDELALCFWIGGLGALYAYLRRPNFLWLTTFLLACALLTFTRPAIYLPFGAALGAYILAPKGASWRRSAAVAAIAAAVIGVVFAVFNFVAHGPGVMEQIVWQYDWQHAVHGSFAAKPIGLWWALSVGKAVLEESVVDVYKNNAWLIVVLAGFGLVLARGTRIFGMLVGAGIATLAAILVNPLELERTVTLPLTPVLVIFATLATAQLVVIVRRAWVERGDAYRIKDQ